MSGIQKISTTQNYNKPLLNAKNTGYLAAGAVALTSIRALTNNKSVVKSHKFFGYTAAAATLLHIGTILSRHCKKNNINY